MEHEVFVPVSVPSLRRTLSDPARVARCVPGLQQDADASADPLSGRLRIRADGHTITYRGALRLTVVPQDGPGGTADSEGREAPERPGGSGDTGGPEGPAGQQRLRRCEVLVVGEGVEARGGGSAKLTLTVALTERDSGTAIRFTGTATGDGRILDLDPSAALTAAVRLLDRFTQQLVTETLTDGEAVEGPQAGAAGGPAEETEAGPVNGPADGPATGAETARESGAEAGRESGAEAGREVGPEAGAEREAVHGLDDAALDEAERSVGEAVEQAIEEGAEEADTTGAATVRPAAPAPGSSGDDETDGVDDGVDDDTPPTPEAAPDEAPSAEGPPGTGSVFDAPVPPPSLDPEDEVGFTVPDGPPAEAAHARRTMIGRSAEEVDHAPPRGRYAPVPSPESTTTGVPLRWVAPAAALALASAVVVGRALRRRR
ncbi:hypothetical protein [Streptomyces sp. NPDC052042]|uniref:hypothetical protein n=1 Tax=Streptomyces sp. NPDC052042 TaxID=3365683 RepID=UPI0037D7C859